MLLINGRKFAKNDREFISTLFETGGTAKGYYKITPKGIRLYDHQRTLFAFVVNNGVGDRFIVSAYLRDGRVWYMHALTSSSESLLGFDDIPYSETIREAEKALEQAGLI